MLALGADMITIKDMSGLIPPSRVATLMPLFKKNLNVPIDFHTHCTPGFGLGAVLSAIIHGVDIVDAVIWNFAGGPAAPAFELIQIFCNKMGIDTGVNLKATAAINHELRTIREELKELDTYEFPIYFDITSYTLPAHIDNLFEQAILFAQTGKYDSLLDACQVIEGTLTSPNPMKRKECRNSWRYVHQHVSPAQTAKAGKFASPCSGNYSHCPLRCRLSPAGYTYQPNSWRSSGKLRHR